MRVLFVSPYFEPATNYGGPVNSNFTLCKTLAKKGIDVHVFTTNANGKMRLSVPLKTDVKVDGLTINYSPLINEFYFISPELIRTVKSQIRNFDVAFFQLMWSHAFAPLAKIACREKLPYIVPMRGQLLPWAIKYKRLRKLVYLKIIGQKCLEKSSGLLCTHPHEADAIKNLGIKATMLVEYNMVDETFFRVKTNNCLLRDMFGIPKNSKIILFLGRLHFKKRPDLALLSLPKDLIKGEEVHLVYVGPDQINFKSSSRSYIENTGLTDRIHFSNFLGRDRVFEALNDADILLMPSESESENFGMSAAEALAVGVPILTSDGVPVGCLAQEAKAGRVITNDPESINRNIVELLSNNELMMKMSKNARNLAQEKFHPDILAGRMIKHLEDIEKKLK